MKKAEPQRRGRGPSQKPNKVNVCLRVDPDIAKALRESGPGWQSRLNGELRAYVSRISS